MSFISHRESIFCKKKRTGISRKRSFGRLKNVTSCTDPRAWSSDKKVVRDFMFETLNNASPSTSSEDTSIYAKIKKSLKVCPKAFVESRRRVRSAENLIVDKDIEKLKSKLNDKNDKIEELKAANKNLKKKNSKCTIEVDNLRNLIKELQEQMEHLEHLKSENIQLRTEVGSDVKNQLAKAEDEIAHLNRELEIFQELKSKYDELRQANETLRTEHSALNRSVRAIKEESDKLVEKCKTQDEEIHSWKARASEITTAICEKNVLQERILTKDKKISKLCESIQNQEIIIQQMNLELIRLTSEFEQRQMGVTRQLEEMRSQLNYKSQKVADLESKLHLSELLVTELEKLREQFRVSNSELQENVLIYKKQFMDTIETSNRMAELAEKLQKELQEKNDEIEKIKQFPQSAKTMVYFAQLNNLINSSQHAIGDNNEKGVGDTLCCIKTVINNLKRDMWGTTEYSSLTDLSDTFSQTEIVVSESSTQISVSQRSILSQTNYPDEYVLKYRECYEALEKLKKTNLFLENARKENVKMIEDLQGKIVEDSNDLAIKESVISNLSDSNDILHEQLMEVTNKLEKSDEMLRKAAEQMEADSKLRASSTDQFEAVMESTINEYSTYVQVLETILDYNENKLNTAYTIINKEENTLEENKEIMKLKQDTAELTSQLEKERSLTAELNKEIKNLAEEITSKHNKMVTVEDELSSTRNFINGLISSVDTGNDLQYFSEVSSSSLEPNEVGFKLTMVLDRYKQEMRTQLEIKNSLNRERLSCKQLKKIVKYTRIEKNNAQKKLAQMNTSVIRVRRIIKGLRKRLLLSEKLITELQNIADLLSCENSYLKKNNTDLIEEIGGLRVKMLNLETTCENQNITINQYDEVKRKTERIVVSLLKKLAKYKAMVHKDKVSHGTMTNEYYMKTVAQRDHLNSEIDILRAENLTLSSTISRLQEKVSTLFDIPQKETKTIEVQVDVKDLLNEEEKDFLYKNVKDHYEAILQALQKEHNSEKEQSQRQYLNNLKMLKDTYERDMGAIKRTHAENLSKLQFLHEEEMVYLKEVTREKDKQIEEKAALEAIHKEEIESMKQRFEKLISQKEELFKDEKEMLTAKMSKTILDKEAEISQMNKEMITSLTKLKSDCKNNLKQLKDRHKAEIDTIIIKCKSEMKRIINKEELKKMSKTEKEVQCDQTEYVDKESLATPDKVSMDDKATEMDHLGGSVNTDDDLLTEDLMYDLVHHTHQSDQVDHSHHNDQDAGKDALSLIPIQDKSHFDPTTVKIGDATISFVQQTSIYAEHIAQLEAELQLKQREFSVKAATYEKMIRSEQMKALEMKHQYEQELEHSKKVHCRLGAQYNKAEELELENKQILNKLKACELQLKLLQENLEKEKDKSTSMKSELNKLKAEPKGSFQLEMSLNRLKEKIEQAVECEKRLTEELKREAQKKEVMKFDLSKKIDIIPAGHFPNENSEKLIQIQTCGVVHWSTEISKE